MTYSEHVAGRIRKRLAGCRHVEEKAMMGGLTFMVNGKMCVGVIKDELVCRINPDLNEAVLERPGCRPMDFTGRPLKGWIMIGTPGMARNTDFDQWINLALDFNKDAQPSKKRK